MRNVVVIGLAVAVTALGGLMAGCGGGGDGSDLAGTWELVDQDCRGIGTSDVSIYAIDRIWTISQEGATLSGTESGTNTLSGTVNELAIAITVNAPDGTVTYSGEATPSGSRINGTWVRSSNGLSGTFVAMKRQPGVAREVSGRWTVFDPVAQSAVVYDFVQTGTAVTGISITDSTWSYSGTLAGSILNLTVIRAGRSIGSVACTLSEGGSICYGMFHNDLVPEVGGLLLYRNE